MFKKYIENTSGNIAVIFAVSLMAILIGVGAAMDISSMSSKRSTYQNIADAAVLAAARSGETDRATLEAIAQDVANGNNNTGDSLSLSLALNAEGRASVTINGTYDTILMGMFGDSTKALEVVAEAPLPSSEPVNIALVLDTTHSMSAGGKIQALKIAATDLVTSLEVFDNDHLKIAVVPFSQYVNVGLSRRNEPWLEDTTDYTTPLADSCSFPVVGTTNCRMERYGATPAVPGTPSRTCYNDGVPYRCGGSAARRAVPGGSRQVCDNVYSPRQVCTPRSQAFTWRGCVGSRTDPWHKRHQFSGNRIPGLINIDCGTEMLALTNNLSDVKAKINAMTVRYETYIPAGLIWGWRALEPAAPLTEAASGAFAARSKKVMILMTDGVNFLSKNGKLHTGSSRSDADDLTTDICRGINAADVEVYTIAYDVNDASTRNLLRGCASESSMYYDARNAADLEAAFKDIGARLLRLRLTH